MIGGMILGGDPSESQLIVRALGPSLADRGLNEVLTDPTLDLRNANGDRVIFNDNWQDDSAQAAFIESHGLAPERATEAAVVASLLPGQYTAIVAGVGGSVGLALVELYAVEPQ